MAVPNTLWAMNGKDADFADLTADTATIATQTITTQTVTTLNATTVNATTVDLNGSATGLILDADADTSFTAPTDDQIDIEIAGADDFRFVANVFRALSGSSLETNTINETTAASGVTVDSLLVKDGGFVAAGTIDANGNEFILDADADTSITADTDDTIDIKVAGADDFQITANTFTALSGSTIATNTIAETTGGSGVTIDGALIKDARTDAGRVAQELTTTGAITINSGLVLLNHATVVIAATLDAPVVGDELIIVDSSATGTAAHTVTLSGGVTWDGTNTVATFNLLGETLHVIAITTTRWLILENIGSVALS